MNKTKILVSLILVLVLVFSVSTSAFAATPPTNVVNLFKKFDMIEEYSVSDYNYILQRFLLNYNGTTNQWITYSGGVDGIFGPGTDAAIRAFQRSVFSNQLEWDGVAGPKTWEKICNNLDYRDRSGEGTIWVFYSNNNDAYVFQRISGNWYVNKQDGSSVQIPITF